VRLPENNDRLTWFLRFVTCLLVVAVLDLAQDVLLPVAFAGLLAFLLSPLVVRLMRWGLPRAIAIILTVTLAFSIIGAAGWVVVTQAVSLVRELPNYEENIRRKIVALKEPATPLVVTRMTGMVENLRREIQAPPLLEKVLPPAPDEANPVPVQVKAAEPTRWEMARNILKPILSPLGTAGIVIVFVVAMLAQREDLRERFIRLISAGRLNVATQAVDDAAARVSRYLGMQLIVNATYGVPIGLGLWLIGIPNALLWGLLATFLRFIPFLGPWIAAIFPVALSVAVDPGWTMLLYTLGLFIAMELVSNNFIEVILYGASTGISNLALLVAAVFWTWLWGPAGLVLSTPLTVCVLVLGNYVPGMNFLSMILGTQPALPPPAQFYQRMLLMDSEDLLDYATKFVAEHSLEEFYEDVFIPGLIMSEEDRHRGTLPEARQRFILQSSRDLIDELERADEARLAAEPASRPSFPAGPPGDVVIHPARDEADELVASVLCHLLRRRGIGVSVTPLGADAATRRENERATTPQVAFVSALPPSAVTAARQLCRRLKIAHPGNCVMVGVWHYRASIEELQNRLRGSQPDAVVTHLAEAVTRLEAALGRTALAAAATAPAAEALVTANRSATRAPH
jgi:predicted PurR-regulated permease PerM